MWTAIKTWWNGLPHGVQALLMAAAGGTVTVVEPVLEAWVSNQPIALCATAGAGTIACLKVIGWQALKGAVAAVLVLYIPSSKYAK